MASNSMETKERSATFLEAVRNSLLRAGKYNRSDMVAPVAILWTDADAQWQQLVYQLRPLMPELLTLGQYDPGEKTGPAIWLRCVIERVLSEIELPEEDIPIIYLPNVSRQTLRAVEECPDSLMPLVELQYRGAVWTQRNGRDWTVEAFLVSEDGGLGLDVAKDKLTRQSMLGALGKLAVTPIPRLEGKRLEAEDFDKLMIEDTPRDLLVWLNAPGETRETWDDKKWGAFRSRCKAEYDFDPEKDGEIVGGEELGMRVDDVWKNVWRRYEESPVLYPGIPDLLRRSKPFGKLIFDKEPWPDENESEEKSLRQDLRELESIGSAEARKKIDELEIRHEQRRSWVWTRLGQSPLAEAMEYLAEVAQYTSQSLGGDSPEAMANLYIDTGYKADKAALLALGSVKTAEDAKAVEAPLRSVYLPWLDDAARHFQALVAAKPLPTSKDQQSGIAAEAGECLLFADSLRFDISRILIAKAEERKLQGTANWRWAAEPTVTATAKPVVSPVANRMMGKQLGEEFRPEIAEGNHPLTTDRFRNLLRSAGYQFLDPSENGDPTQAEACAWTEFGDLDKLGHKLQSKLAARIDEQLDLLLDRIQELLKDGWKKVRVVTDHGWLLVPGGLPDVKLPKYLTECRWSRCAVIKESAKVDFPMAGWYWNPNEQYASGPGVHCFAKGNEYAHGGVSLQECLIPDLTFHLSEKIPTVSARILDVQWFGMRCRATIDASGAAVTADLRTKPNDQNSSVATPKAVESDGRVSVLVEDESLEGTVVSLVIIDASGLVLGKQATTVGGDE